MSSYLKFQVSFHTNINQTVRIIGNIKDLGEWDVSKGLQLQTNAQIYPDWTHDTFLEIPYGTLIEFKCVKLEGERLIKWENFSIDMNRKYKTQYFKALLFMKEDNIQVIERPFQKYTGNHDCDIIDTTNAKKIQEKFIIFDPLRKADGLSSSSDNSSLDFFRRQSKASDEFGQLDPTNQPDGNNGIKRIRDQPDFSDDDDEDEDYFNSMGAEIDNAGWEANNEGIEGVGKELQIQQPEAQNKRKSMRIKGLGIKFNASSLNQIEGKVPRHLENIFLLFNRSKKEAAQQQQTRDMLVRKISDFKNISYYGIHSQQQQQQQQQQQSYQQQSSYLQPGGIPNSISSNPSSLKGERIAKSLPEIAESDMNEKTERTLVIVSFKLPYTVKSKKRKGAKRLAGNINTTNSHGSIEQSYEFSRTFDPLIDSINESFSNVKLRVVWLGICNIYPETQEDRDQLRTKMLEKYHCWPLFYQEKQISLFARQFCSYFLYPQTDQAMFCEEDPSWEVYKLINADVANTLKVMTRSQDPIFAVAVFDFHFFLVPSYFQKQKKRCSGSVQQFDQKEKITISFFMDRKFPALQILEMLPQAEIFMHSLFFCDIMSFSTYEACEPFLSLAQKMGCAVVYKAGGKVVLQCNGREIFIRIEHPGINISKLQKVKDQIQQECEMKALVLHKQERHLIVGIDSISKNSGLELKFIAFEKFLKREKYLKSNQDYKLKQIVYFSSDGEFFTYAEQQDYLEELKQLARSINQTQCFYESVIEIIECECLLDYEYYQYLSLSECFISTSLQESRHEHYMDYLFLKKDGQVILSHSLNQLASFNAVNIVNPQDTTKVEQTLTRVFKNIAKMNHHQKLVKSTDNHSQNSNNNSIINNRNSSQSLINKSKFFSPHVSGDKQQEDDSSSGLQEEKQSDSSESNNIKQETITMQNDRSRINITEKNNTSDQAQREFDYNYLIKFCSTQTWISHFIGDIVKRQSFNRDTCIFCSTEEKTIVLDKPSETMYHEAISKIYERNSSQYVQINLQNLIYKCKNARNCVFVFGFSSVFFETPSNLLAEPKTNIKLFQEIKTLAAQHNTTVYIISGKSPELLYKYFGDIPNITLISHNGLKIQNTSQDVEAIALTKPQDPTFLKMCVATRIENFVQKTAGSYIIESEISTSWHFENVEKEFADAQKEELVKQLIQIVESMPGYEIFEGYDFIQVRPSCLNKGIMTKIVLQNCYLRKGKIDLLVIVGGRKTTDEEMLKSAREVVYDEKISYIENNTPIILGSISCQLGALYCNHQFENNNELAVLLELMNGNKQLLMADQFTHLSDTANLSNKSNYNNKNPNEIDKTNCKIDPNHSDIANNKDNQSESDNNRMCNTQHSFNNNTNFLPLDPPHLLRKQTMCVQNYTPIGATKQQQVLQQKHQDSQEAFEQSFPFPLTPEYSYQQSSYEQLEKKPKIKAFDIKIPFINQMHTLNQIQKQMI